jgi:hypothetical protein
MLFAGLGGGGGRVSAVFASPPVWLKPSDPTERFVEGKRLSPIQAALYPRGCVVFDTNERAREELLNAAYDGYFFLIPGMTVEEMVKVFSGGGSAPISFRDLRSAFEGAGRNPILAREQAKRLFQSQDNSAKTIRQDLRDNLRVLQGFERGVLLTFHSLIGGTGSGIAPIVLNFFMKDVMQAHPGLAPDLGILPSAAELNGNDFYPANAIASLHYVLKERVIPDGVILVDNDQLKNALGCKNNTEYNLTIQDALLPIVLAPLPQFVWKDFRDQPDYSNIRTIIRENRGGGRARFCTLGYASRRVPRLMVNKDSLLRSLIRDAFHNTFVDLGGDTKRGGTRPHPDAVVVVLSGPDSFYMKTLKNDDSIDEWLTEEIVKYLGPLEKPRTLIHYLHFPGMEDVSLSILMAGIDPPKLREVWQRAMGKPLGPAENLADAIRNLDDAQIDEIAVAEVRKGLSLD